MPFAATVWWKRARNATAAGRKTARRNAATRCERTRSPTRNPAHSVLSKNAPPLRVLAVRTNANYDTAASAVVITAAAIRPTATAPAPSAPPPTINPTKPSATKSLSALWANVRVPFASRTGYNHVSARLDPTTRPPNTASSAVNFPVRTNHACRHSTGTNLLTTSPTCTSKPARRAIITTATATSFSAAAKWIHQDRWPLCGVCFSLTRVSPRSRDGSSNTGTSYSSSWPPSSPSLSP